MNDEQITRLLQDLVRIPSVNPSGDPGTAAKNTGEARMAEYVADFLRKLALDVELHEVEPGRPNVIGKFASRGGKRSLALAPHTDTVSVAGMTIDPFGGEVRDGKLYGRGATDTKGPMASALAALANAVRQKEFREGNLDVYFCALMGEESGNDGARALMEREFKVAFAIACEPTDCRVVYTHKGALWFKVITRGRSVHGSIPDKGESAIKKMAEVVQYVLGEYTQQLRKHDNKTLGAPTVNIGVIRGGAQTNIVPDYCEIEVDRRTVPGEKHEEILSQLRDALNRLPVETDIIRDCHPLFTDPKNAFVQKLTEAVADMVVRGQETDAQREASLDAPRSTLDVLVGAPWFCDAGIFAENGVPAVAFGPGSVAQAHIADEFIELREVDRAARITERFLLANAVKNA
jgi:acetylornithine deacetylase/succinyl-diaminopimelate desuccinylase family protein